VPTRKSLLDGNLLSLLLGGANSVLLQLFHSPEYFPRFAFPNKLFDSNFTLEQIVSTSVSILGVYWSQTD